MKRLYVGNIPFKANEQDLRNWFAQYGFGTDNVQIIRDRFLADRVVSALSRLATTRKPCAPF